jgi:hypothetical protein
MIIIMHTVTAQNLNYVIIISTKLLGSRCGSAMRKINENQKIPDLLPSLGNLF